MLDKAKKATTHDECTRKNIYINHHLFPGVIMYRKASLLITGSIVMTAVVTLYTVNVANAQSINMTEHNRSKHEKVNKGRLSR
ncbi:MAG: hypothetical protein WBZ36_19210 [Candidatus Nitrosopolaris sp.]